jgi:UDP-N-acetylmuramate dehydrogenase
VYEIFNILHSIKINNEWISADEIEHGYRFAKLGGIATHAKFEITHGFDQKLLDELLALRSNQPLEPSAGSVFKNPEDDYAGRLIEAVGLKGVRKGQMQWSTVHANFLVNLGGGTYEEAKSLIDLAKSEVLKRFNIALIEEIKIL